MRAMKVIHVIYSDVAGAERLAYRPIANEPIASVDAVFLIVRTPSEPS